LDPTNRDVDYFSQSQLKRLLILASGSTSRLPEINDIDEVSRLIAMLCARQGDTEPDLVAKAAAGTTSVEELRHIKDRAKRLLDDACGPMQGAAARLLYHVAVAAALGRTGVDISSRPIANRRLMYERLRLTFWGHPVADVFRLAADRISRSSR